MCSHMERTSGTARLDSRGRLVLRAGDEVRMSVEREGVLRVESGRAAAHALIGLAGWSPKSPVEELLADRRLEAAAEEAEASCAAQSASSRSDGLAADRR